MIILRGLTFLNPNWIKSYEIKHKLFHFKLLAKKTLKIYDSQMAILRPFLFFFISNCIGIFYKIPLYKSKLTNIYRYGLQSDVQVTQADVARLETKFKVSVLRLLYHQSGQQKSGNPNEAAFALNFICDQLYAYSQDNPKDDQQKSKAWIIKEQTQAETLHDLKQISRS